jgi:phosphonate degradation associated HDIG domain protein
MPLTLEAISALFAAHGSRMYSGEPVTQLEHALQSAALAEEAGASASLVTASLLHDLGHMIKDQGETPTLRGIDDRHEYVAIPRLRGLFSDAVLMPIRLHVEAKRYLCARGDGSCSGPQYLAALSPDSLRSLRLQGGVFSSEQADAFIAQQFADDAVLVRRWDDLAKQAGRMTPRLEHYLALAASVALA